MELEENESVKGANVNPAGEDVKPVATPAQDPYKAGEESINENKSYFEKAGFVAATDLNKQDVSKEENESGKLEVGVGHAVTLTAPDADKHEWTKTDDNANPRDEAHFKNSKTFRVSFNLPGKYSYKVKAGDDEKHFEIEVK